MIRKVEHRLLQAISIEGVGDTKAVRNAVLLMTRIGKNSIAVRDADKGPDVANGIFSFPGTKPPEKEVYENQAVKEHLNATFNIDIDNVIALKGIEDHHKLTEGLSEAANTLTDYFRTVAINKYLEEIGIDQYEQLVQEVHQRA